MEFLETAFPLLLIPSGCWLLGLFAMRNMSRTRKNLLSALSLLFTVTLMIALLLLRLFLPETGFRYSAKAALFAVTLTLCGGVGIFLRAWSLYWRDRLSEEEIFPYCLSALLMLSGAVAAFHIACFCTPID
ncbi:MAG: hypothetical protein IJR72_02295 [Oscillospiraceae bacterium]|nr:hypothetical protein [Oscillospiraceae bacterium]